ncbi:sigma factor-like helix-turn-helix DNA-binding protein [Streptomyces sp. NPDC003077]|uniref:sigma factor-like helix-turn-helix DNA-binding protein n=1 Tax=Streptomyces sp. NPDC003077 TaxID=3154443 RepID=UPI0033A1645A
MRERRIAQERRRAQEFERFVAGAGGRLLRAAGLLTGEPDDRPGPAAEHLLVTALARTYADWDRLRGEDPYARARQELVRHFAHTAWRHRHPRGGLLDRLSPQERLVLVLRLYEGVAEEQTAAQLGLPTDRVHELFRRALGAMRSGSPAPLPGARPSPGNPPGPAPDPTLAHPEVAAS